MIKNNAEYKLLIIQITKKQNKYLEILAYGEISKSIYFIGGGTGFTNYNKEEMYVQLFGGVNISSPLSVNITPVGISFIKEKKQQY